ncbi:MAG TPA: mechanosensitive ion channel domain-containing protein [Terriglobales bacterium]|nr:mechanosensitive ion channel domain-containing protein [Terriglobales bacterium]
MKARQWITVAVLFVLLLATILGLFFSDSTHFAAPAASKKNAAASQPPAVDQKPLQTARKLAGLASTPEEQDFAHEALRLADYEVDLAFADALREAAEHPPAPTAEQRELSVRAAKAAAVVKSDQDQITHLTHRLAAASEGAKEDIEDQIDVAKAQLELDQDELDDAKQDLQRAGGNPQGAIQRLLEEHEAAGHIDAGAPSRASTAATPTSADSEYQSRNLAPQIRAWLSLRSKSLLLADARQAALNDIPVLTRAHDAFDQRVKAQEDQKQLVKQKATGLANGEAPADGASKKQAAKDALTALRHLSEDQKAVSDLDKRIQDQQELADIYSNWGALVATRQRTALHELLESALWILLIVLVVYLVGRLIDRYFLDLTSDKKRLVTLRAVVWFAVQAVGVLLIAFVVFGMPSQTPTVLGLAGAGLTVALKDFIVGFVGWFVLMGRNGIRVGDWVEINGVGGEVVEIGLLRTVLLETGNWTDSGHPTGRKVTFVNSFAIEGHYFNFSTSGQWLWDELTVSVPSTQNPYPVIEAIQKLVVKETEENVRSAEDEWQKATTRYRVKSFSAKPAINLRPTGGGVEVHVRYITRAQDRQSTRAHLYEAIVELLHGKEAQPAATNSAHT